MDVPIIIWPDGTFYANCADYGAYYDCTWYYPQVAQSGGTVCCPF